MATQLIQMSGKEFVKKVLSGERDFSGIRIQRAFNLSGYFSRDKLQRYLIGQSFRDNPLDISNSDFLYVNAAGLYLPHVKGEGVDLTGANLERTTLCDAYLVGANLKDANLLRADLREANLRAADLTDTCLLQANLAGSDLTGAYLLEAYLREANLAQANLMHADLTGANLERTNLLGANLKYVKNLESVDDLEYAFYSETIITPRERRIIESRLRPLFIEE